jgi:hypothetical protein
MGDPVASLLWTASGIIHPSATAPLVSPFFLHDPAIQPVPPIVEHKEEPAKHPPLLSKDQPLPRVVQHTDKEPHQDPPVSWNNPAVTPLPPAVEQNDERPTAEPPARRRSSRACVKKTNQKIQNVLRTEEHHQGDDNYEWSRRATLGHGVSIKESEIKEAGMGLFADRDFDKNDIITEYTGQVINDAAVCDLDNINAFTYVAGMPPKLNIDGFRRDVIKELPDGTRGCGSMANDPRDHTRTNCATYNSDFAPRNVPEPSRTGISTPFRLWLLATKPIKRGEEIFFAYGAVYWEKHDKVSDWKTRKDNTAPRWSHRKRK